MYVTLKGKSKTGAQTVQAPNDLPFSYNKTELVLLVRDPEWAYSYWDFSSETWNWIQSILKSKPGAAAKLRVHNLSAGNYFERFDLLNLNGQLIHSGKLGIEAKLSVETFTSGVYILRLHNATGFRFFKVLIQ